MKEKYMQISEICQLESCELPHSNNHEGSYMVGPIRHRFCTTEHLGQHIKRRLDQFKRVRVEASNVHQATPTMAEAVSA
jgi:hypothetical protein